LTNTVVDSAANCVFIEDFLYSQIECTYIYAFIQGKSGKYTKYSDHTGITKTEGQSTVDTDVKNISFDSNTSEDAEMDNGDTNETASQENDTATIEGVTLLLQKFASDRLWNRYHTPRNIALALMGEVGELAELFQWHGDVGSNDDGVNIQAADLLGVGWSDEEVDKVGQEIADVSIYLMRLADVCGVSLGEVSVKLIH
jgi:NTP pyrophosphatase (non-canonical NTP hydrolase)